MGVTSGTNVAITRFIKKMDRLEAFASNEAYDALDEIGAEATAYMRQIVTDQSNATYFSLDAQDAGLNRGPGRVRTGAMLNSIDYWDTSVGSGDVGSRLSIAFGYHNAPPSNKYPNVSYAKMQETGFLNKWLWRRPIGKNRPYYNKKGVGKQKWHITPGIFAIRDAALYARTVVRPQVASAASAAIARRMRGA